MFLGPWIPFLIVCLGRAAALTTFLLWVEGFFIGTVPQALRNAAFYAAAAYVVYGVIRQIVDSATTGQTPDMNVTVEQGTFRDDGVLWAAAGMRGWREAMEDQHVAQMLDPGVFPDVALFAVLDGHGGKDVSGLAYRLLAAEIEACGYEQIQGSKKEDLEPCLEKALQEALPRLDAKLRNGPSWAPLGRVIPSFLHPFGACGSTACVAAVDFGKREVLVANVGDSRTILARSGKALALSEDHKPENAGERARIRAAGGQVVKLGPCHRVDGNLNLSRALGDFNLKANAELPPEQQKVIAFPDTKRLAFNGGPEELLIVACDGLFERLSNQELVDFIWPLLRQGKSLDLVAKELLRKCCARGNRGRPMEEGTDNETVILVKLPPAPTDAASPQEDLRAGQQVEVHGLESEAGRQLNGQAGVAEGPTEGKPGRFDVRLSGSGQVKSFKAENLRRVDESS